MIYCETGSVEKEGFADLAVFVSQLNAAGLEARMDARTVPEGSNRNMQFDVAPFLFSGDLAEGDRVVIIHAGAISDAKLSAIRRLNIPALTTCLAVGHFSGKQAILNARAKLSYVFGDEPEIHDLARPDVPLGDIHPGAPVFGVARARRRPLAGAKLEVLLIDPDLEDRGQVRALKSLNISRFWRVSVLTDGKTKDAWISVHGNDIAFYHYGELLPAQAAGRFDIAVLCRQLSASYRMRSLMANLAVSSAVLLDASAGHAISRQHDAFRPAPPDISALGPFLSGEILPVMSPILDQVAASAFARAADGATALRAIAGLAAPGVRSAGQAGGSRALAGAAPQAVFVPTNGVGLGHAQRTALIAAEIDRGRVRPVFGAFPSCMKMLQSYGFDVMPLVSRSGAHREAFENDLVNYTRLRALSKTAASLVFDGGYIFDSIFRAIFDHGLTGIWIRRGLWQSGQDNSIALDREKAFARVVIPAEAFAELNESYSRGPHVETVGPVVQRVTLGETEKVALRAALSDEFGCFFERLVVTMLGGGVAADRRAQTAALCSIMERRDDTLHLVVVWPTAVIEPGWLGWRNTRIVKTHHASVLLAAADLCISAAGYNSFHELIYNGVPTIFMPQMNSYMDDQHARAMAAVKRDIAAIIAPHQMMRLEAEIGVFLEEGRAEEVRERLAGLWLPEPGTTRAARIIEEASDAR